MTTQLDPFEDRVLAALREHVTERTAAPPAPERRRTAGWWVAGIGVAATVAAAGLVLVPGLGPESAYSVQEGNADQIQVLEGLEGGLVGDLHLVPAQGHGERAVLDHPGLAQHGSRGRDGRRPDPGPLLGAGDRRRLGLRGRARSRRRRRCALRLRRGRLRRPRVGRRGLRRRCRRHACCRRWWPGSGRRGPPGS